MSIRVSKEIRKLGGSRHSVQLRPSVSQDPLAGCVVVLNFGGPISQDDHVARVVRQLLWREDSVDH